MKVIGFSAGVIGHESNVDRMVKAIMDKSGFESEGLQTQLNGFYIFTPTKIDCF